LSYARFFGRSRREFQIRPCCQCVFEKNG